MWTYAKKFQLIIDLHSLQMPDADSLDSLKNDMYIKKIIHA